MITIGAIRALHHLGRQHDVALIGFDDLALADTLRPGVTVMAQDPTRMGTIAAERLFARLDGDRIRGGDHRGPGPADRPRLRRDPTAPRQLASPNPCTRCMASIERSVRLRTMLHCGGRSRSCG